MVEGIRSNKVCGRLLRLGTEIALKKALDICKQTSMTEKKMNNWQCDEKRCSMEKTKQDFEDKMKSTSHQTGHPSSCRNCGRQHPSEQCPALGKKCRKCKKKNHWVKCCFSLAPTRIIKAFNKKDPEECYDN